MTTCYAQIGPKTNSVENLLKFGLIDISDMPISILMSKIYFMKYLPPVRPKLFPKLKMLIIYWNFADMYWWTDFDSNDKNDFYEIFNCCLPINPKVNIAQKFMFEISGIPISSTTSDLLNILSQILLKLLPSFSCNLYYKINIKLN